MSQPNPGNQRFDALDAAMRQYVDGAILPCASYAILKGRDVVHQRCIGCADLERRVPLRPDHLFRVFSNTKLVTSCAALLLVEERKLTLQTPVADILPQLAGLRVLRAGAQSIDETEPARAPMLLRHLMSHSAGFSYGLFDPDSVMFKAYNDRQILHPGTDLAAMIDQLAQLPLSYHPGTSWEYSVASDVLGRVIEVVSGQQLGEFFRTRIFEPLGMKDTAFVVPPADRGRLVRLYAGADLLDPMRPGLTPLDDFPYPGAFRVRVSRQSGGSGLVSSLGDMVALVRSLQPGGTTLLGPATLDAAMSNQLPPGVCLKFPHTGPLTGKGYGLAGSVTLVPSRLEPAAAAGELAWGGVGGTHWWISPHTGVAAVLMTQRHMSFWHPFSFDFKRRMYEAMA